MSGIIVTMPKYEDALHIADIIRRNNISGVPIVCSLGRETLEKVRSREIDIVICTKKFKDMGYEELVDNLPSNVNVILLTKDESLIPFSSNVRRLLIPFKKADLLEVLQQSSPYIPKKEKAKKSVRSYEEQKIIDGAKLVLMESKQMSEPDAFRYIQKNSMDNGRSMVETAQMILLMKAE